MSPLMWGGHLSSSLGCVELAVSLLATFDSPTDKIIWDVGHQAYPHKILTGRIKEFETLRSFGGLSGFPRRGESPHDVFTSGHASTSISQALGIAKARDLAGDKYHVVTVIGDGALSGGLALEGINNALNLKTDLIVVLNDNQLSITKSVGAISDYLTKVRTSQLYTSTKDRVERTIKHIPRIGEPMVKSIIRFKDRVKHFLVDFKFGVILEELGFRYFGPIDGHNIPLVMSTLHFARDIRGPVFVHVLTKKGKGYAPAEENPVKFHGTPPFDIKTGSQVKTEKSFSFTSIFGRTLARLGEGNKRIVAITAAMLDGTGLDEFARRFPERFYDVGIAEEHAVSFASGLASQGFKPVVAIYSTFLQRAYDQVIHDVCLNDLPVLFAIDRGGLVGEDGPTHHGDFDMAYMRAIPNMVVMAPKDENELQHMLHTAIKHDGPVSIRYPRGNGLRDKLEDRFIDLEIGKGEVSCSTNISTPKAKVLLVSIGSMVYPSCDAARLLAKENIDAVVINARFVKPLDSALIVEKAKTVDIVVTVEEGCLSGGFGSAVNELLELEKVNVPVMSLGIPDKFIGQGKRQELLRLLGLDAEGIANAVKEGIKA